MRRVALFALPVYWVALFAVTHYPRVPMPNDIPQGDKIVHFAAFGVLAALYAWFMHARERRIGWLDAAILFAYAALDEWLQQFFGRHTDALDFVANASGIAVVLAITWASRRASR